MKATKYTKFLPFILVILIFSLNVHRAINLDMYKQPSSWAVDAIPSVLSNKYYDSKKYLVIKEVKESFADQHSALGSFNLAINSVIKKIQDSQILDTTSYEVLGNDDKGIVDYVNLAFSLFGNNVESMFILYYFLLGISCKFSQIRASYFYVGMCFNGKLFNFTLD